MILVCPSCKANFKVPDGAIPPEGRKVRCAKCKHSWHATPAQALKPQASARPQAAAAGAVAGAALDMDAGLAARTAQIRRELGTPPPAPAAPPSHDESFDEDDFSDEERASEEESGLITQDDFGVGAALRGHLSDVSDEIEALAEEGFDEEEAEGAEDAEAYDDDDFLARRRAEQRRQGERDARARMRRVIVGGWVLWLVAIVALLAVLVFGKDTLTEKWPASKVIYRWFDSTQKVDSFHPDTGGKPLTKPITETEVYVKASLEPPKVEERNGRMALVINGFVENTGTRAANVPRLKIEITDGHGNVLDSWVFDPPGLVLRRGGRLPFEQVRAPIPIGAALAKVKVLEGTKSVTKAE